MEITESLNLNNENTSDEIFSCPVCLSEKGEEDRCITECNHEFCKECINKWFDKKTVSCRILLPRDGS